MTANNNQTKYRRDIPKEMVHKDSSFARWTFPSILLALLGGFFLVYFLPLGIAFFIAALVIIALSVMGKSEPR